VELLTSTVYTFFCFVDIGGIVDQHCLHFLCFVDIGGIVDQHCLPFFCFVEQNKESVNSVGQQFHQYQQNKRKFKQ
jgi:hypothetical protein